MKPDYATYHVALKALLKKEGEILFLTFGSQKHLDLPGGRINTNEDSVPLQNILAREIKEELGKNVRYKLGKPAFQFRRFFTKNRKKVSVFITVYEAEFLSGSIKLSFEHNGYAWISLKTLVPQQKDFSHKEEYLSFKQYLKTCAK